MNPRLTCKQWSNGQWDRGADCELVLPEEAERYWKITPTAEAANVVAFGNL
jgi:hypothetical protein